MEENNELSKYNMVVWGTNNEEKERLERIIMSADEMFKKLGYEKNEFEDEIDYEINGTLNQWYIVFYKEHKTFNASGCVSMETLQAINKKCKELGWLD